MKRYWVPVFCSLLFQTIGSVTDASAQGSKAAAQVHIDRAKAAAYRTGSDLTMLYETVCAPAISDKGPVIPTPTEAGKPPPPLPIRRFRRNPDGWFNPPKASTNPIGLEGMGNSN